MLVFVFLSLNGSFHVLNLPEMNKKKKQIDFNSFGLFFCTFDTKVESIKMNRRWSGTRLVLGIQHFVRTLFVLSFLFISMASNSFFFSLSISWVFFIFHLSREIAEHHVAMLICVFCPFIYLTCVLFQMGELLLRVIYCFSYRIYTPVVYACAYAYAYVRCPCLCTYALYFTQIGFI